MVRKRDPKVLRAIDAVLTLHPDPLRPDLAATTRGLVQYFKAGGKNSGYDFTIDVATAVLCGHKTRQAGLDELSRITDADNRLRCEEVYEALLNQYATRITKCKPIPSRRVKVRGQIGVKMPAALHAILDGKRRFIIPQPRRSDGPTDDWAGLYLSMFNEKYSIDEDYGTLAEMLDMRRPLGSQTRKIQAVRSEDLRCFSKREIDDSLAVYAAAMELIIADPRKFGVDVDLSRIIQMEMDEFWG